MTEKEWLAQFFVGQHVEFNFKASEPIGWQRCVVTDVGPGKDDRGRIQAGVTAVFVESVHGQKGNKHYPDRGRIRIVEPLNLEVESELDAFFSDGD